MRLYVMRHAEAVEGSETLPDEWRYLTEKGRRGAKLASTALSKYGPKPRLTITSPLTRAVQTAEIVAEKACRRNIVLANSLLLPGSPIGELIVHLKTCQEYKRVIIVGHEPQLGQLVGELLGGEDRTIGLKKGACVALEFDPAKDKSSADFLWYLVPGKKRTSSLKKAFPPA